MPTKGIIAPWASYSFTGPIFHTISLRRCEKCKTEILRVECNKRLIQYEAFFILQLKIQ
jgi:hypothetical protein